MSQVTTTQPDYPTVLAMDFDELDELDPVELPAAPERDREFAILIWGATGGSSIPTSSCPHLEAEQVIKSAERDELESQQKAKHSTLS